MHRRLTGEYDHHDGNGVLYGRFPREYGGHDVLGVRLAFGALAERHGRVACLPQQQVALEEGRHGQRHGIQGRHGFCVTPHLSSTLCGGRRESKLTRPGCAVHVNECSVATAAAAAALRPLE